MKMDNREGRKERDNMAGMRVGIIGYGEAGQAVAQGLRSDRKISMSVFDIRFNNEESSQLLKAKADEFALVVEKDIGSLVEKNDIILSIVTGGVALKVVEQSLPFIKKGKLYVDMNSVSPGKKTYMGELIEGRGGSFIEVAILGTIASYGFKSPMLVCGKEADHFVEFLTPMGFNAEFLSKEIGKASSIKMLRSIFAKGVETLLIEMLLGAARSEIVEQLMDAITEHMDNTSFRDIANAWITTHVIHNRRRAEEMEYVIETLEELKVKPIMATAARDRLRSSSQLGLTEFFHGEKPEEYRQVIDAMLNMDYV